MPDLPPDPTSSGGEPGNLAAEAVKLAITKIRDASHLTDLERAIGLVKVSAEIEKLVADKEKAEQDKKKVIIDSGLASKQMRLAWLTAIFAPLVPIASLLTVMVTLFVANAQMRNSAEQAQESNWTAFVLEVGRSTPDQLYASPTFAARLMELAASGKHKEGLEEIVKKLMIGVSTFPAFESLWKLQIKAVTSDNINSLVELARGKNLKASQLQASCQQTKIPAGLRPDSQNWIDFLGPCSPNYTDREIRAATSEATHIATILDLRTAFTNNGSIQYFLSTQIADYLREVYRKGKKAPSLDLSGITLAGVSLEDVDMSELLLRQTTFSGVFLKGAVFTPKISTTDLRGTTWWDADSIDQRILPILITYAYAAYPQIIFPAGYQISREEYTQKVLALCTTSLKICTKACIRYGTDPQPNSADCQLQ